MVTIEQFSRVRSAIEAGGETSEVLHTEGISRATWRAAERRFIALLIGEVERGENRHRRVFREAMGEVMAAPEPPQPTPAPEATASFEPPRPVFAPAPTRTRGTTDVPPAPSPAPVPFSGVVAIPRSLASEVAAEAEDMLGATVTVSALSDEDLADPLPFADGDGLDTTASLTAIDFGHEPAIPFEGSGVAPPAIGSIIAEEARELVGETGSVAALPDSELTLQQYASLLVELERAAPDQRIEIMHRYAVADDETFSRIQRTWTERFRVEPATYGRFRSAYDAYSAWLEGS